TPAPEEVDDLGAAHFQRGDHDRLVAGLTRRRHHLGYESRSAPPYEDRTTSYWVDQAISRSSGRDTDNPSDRWHDSRPAVARARGLRRARPVAARGTAGALDRPGTRGTEVGPAEARSAAHSPRLRSRGCRCTGSSPSHSTGGRRPRYLRNPPTQGARTPRR